MKIIFQTIHQYLKQLTQAQTLWVGFSGGLDSTVLLHALAQMPELKSKLKAIHVHHGLSANADAWLEHCQQFCQQLDIPFVAEKVQLVGNKDGIEQAARDARYQAYKKHAREGDYLLQAHHGDDQIETFLMRVTRGAGLQGLASIPKQRELSSQVTILRPLLSIPRAVLEEYAFKQQLSWVEDESNQDSSYERNWWRNELLPQIKQQFPQRQTSFLRSVEQLQQDAQLLNDLLAPSVEQVLRLCSWPNCADRAIDIVALKSLPELYWPYIVRIWLKRYNILLPSQAWLRELLRVLDQSAEESQPKLQLAGYEVFIYRQKLFLHRPASAPVQPLDIYLQDKQVWLWAGGELVAESAQQGLLAGEYQLVSANTLSSQQRLQPVGRPSKTLKALFQEQGIPKILRGSWPALMRNGELCVLVGVAVDQNYLISDSDASSGFILKWHARLLLL